MSLQTESFARKPFFVDAVRVTETNMEEVAEWCHGSVKTDSTGKHVKVRVHRPLNERQTKAFPGDWVLYAGTGFKVYSQKAFEKNFEPTPELVNS